MEHQTNRQFRRDSKGPQKFLPWIILGAAALIVLGILGIQWITNLSKEPPRPKGTFRISRVNLIVESNVDGAEVYLNGEKKTVTDYVNRRAKILKLAPQKYELTLKKEGYADRTETVEITGKAISQTVKIDMVPSD